MTSVFLGTLALVAVAYAFLRGAGAILAQAGETRFAVTFAFATLALMTLPVVLAEAIPQLVATSSYFGALLGVTALLLPKPKVDWPERPSMLGTVSLLVLSFLLVFAVFRVHLWDEFNGHLPMTGALARGVSPPVHPFYPDQPMPYHYGYDALAGVIRAFTGLSTHAAGDVASLWLFVGILLVGSEVAVTLHAPGWVGSVLLPLGAGLGMILFLPDSGTIEPPKLNLLPAKWYRDVPPGTISNFFQHPQGAGMATSIAVLLFFVRSTTGRWRRPILVFAVGALSIAHSVYFGLMGLGLGAAACLRVWRTKDGRAFVADLIMLIAGLGLAFSFGGTLRGLGHSSLRSGSQLDKGVLMLVGRHLLLFAPQLLILLWVPFSKRKFDELAAGLWVASLVGFAVPCFLVYERSWDIVKFYGAGLFFANAFVVSLIGTFHRSGHRVLAGGLFAVCTLSGTLWLLRMSVLDGRLGVPPMHFAPPSAVYQKLDQTLSQLIPPHDRVFATNMGVAGATGFMTPGFSPDVCGATLPYDLKPLYELNHVHSRARRTLAPELLDKLGVSWVVLSPADESFLAPEARARLYDPKHFEKVAEVDAGGEQLRAYRRLEPRSTSP